MRTCYKRTCYKRTGYKRTWMETPTLNRYNQEVAEEDSDNIHIGTCNMKELDTHWRSRDTERMSAEDRQGHTLKTTLFKSMAPFQKNYKNTQL